VCVIETNEAVVLAQVGQAWHQLVDVDPGDLGRNRPYRGRRMISTGACGFMSPNVDGARGRPPSQMKMQDLVGRGAPAPPGSRARAGNPGFVSRASALGRAPGPKGMLSPPT